MRFFLESQFRCENARKIPFTVPELRVCDPVFDLLVTITFPYLRISDDSPTRPGYVVQFLLIYMPWGKTHNFECGGTRWQIAEFLFGHFLGSGPNISLKIAVFIFVPLRKPS